jgi:hypothetical protein
MVDGQMISWNVLQLMSLVVSTRQRERLSPCDVLMTELAGGGGNVDESGV